MNLSEASKNGDIKRINQLLDEGVDINIRDSNGWTALMVASRYSNNGSSLDTVRLLLDRGTDINIQEHGGWTALMVASRHSNNDSSLDTVRLLLDRGADTNIQDNNGWTPLMSASRYSNNGSSLDTVRLLLDRGAGINIQDSKEWTPLMVASGESNHDSSLETVKLLLENRANINIQDNAGMTALMYSSKLSNRESSVDTIKILLEYGADPFLLNHEKKSALEICSTKECEDVLSKSIWERLYKRDINMARNYSKSGDIKLPKDIWELILLNKRQQQLCKNLSSNKNRNILLLFALELGIPIDNNITKAQLCGIISRQLAYGKYYSEASKKYNDSKLREDISNVKSIAFRFGIDINRPLEQILNDLTKLMK